MSIASGYKKFKKYILTSSGFQLVSHWTKANTLEFDDGKTAQDKLGAIDGISSSRESNSDKIAASTALVSELNSDLGGNRFGVTDDGLPGWKEPGADTVIPFNRVEPLIISYMILKNGTCSWVDMPLIPFYKTMDIKITSGNCGARKFLNCKQVGDQYWAGSTTIDIASALNTYNSLRYYPGYDNGAGGGNVSVTLTYTP